MSFNLTNTLRKFSRRQTGGIRINSADDKLVIFFFSQKKDVHFIQHLHEMPKHLDNMHEMSNAVFWENYYYFSQKKSLAFHANCLLMFGISCKYFLGKIRKIFQNVI